MDACWQIDVLSEMWHNHIVLRLVLYSPLACWPPTILWAACEVSTASAHFPSPTDLECSFPEYWHKLFAYSFSIFIKVSWASLVAPMMKNLPAVQETWVPSLGQEDLLEKGMAAHSSILAWKFHERGAW